MSGSRQLPKFDAVHFESLSHTEKLEVLNKFLEALNSAKPALEAVEKPDRQPRRARESS